MQRSEREGKAPHARTRGHVLFKGSGEAEEASQLCSVGLHQPRRWGCWLPPARGRAGARQRELGGGDVGCVGGGLFRGLPCCTAQRGTMAVAPAPISRAGLGWRGLGPCVQGSGVHVVPGPALRKHRASAGRPVPASLGRTSAAEIARPAGGQTPPRCQAASKPR